MNNIYSFTGNPFVDNGIAFIMAYCKRKNPEDITLDDINKTKEYLSKNYFDASWVKCLFSVFPNSSITNPSIKGERKKQAWGSFIDDIIDDIQPQSNTGDCISCGRRNIVNKYSKTNIPLTGSGSLRNFFSYAADGADYCPACAFAIQVSPMCFYMCRNLIMLHSSNYSVLINWAKTCLNYLNRQLSLNNLSGCYNDSYTNPVNAVFHIADILIDEYEDEIEDGTEITVYYFTNYNQGPDLEIYRVPGNIFTFIKHIYQLKNRGEWNKIVKKGYNLEFYKKVNPEDEETYKNIKNTVYKRLLNGESILGYFFERGKRQIIGDFYMLSIYLKEVRFMEKERIDVIKTVADRIAEYIKRTDNLKRLSKLEMSNTSYEFKNQLRLITKGKLKNGDEEPLFTLDEYVDYLFPDGNWRETQDMILFRIYEKLFDWLKQKNLDELEEDIEKEGQE